MVNDAALTRIVVEDLLARMAGGDPENIAALYAPTSDWKLNWPEDEHGRVATAWITHRSTRADAAAHFRAIAEHHIPVNGTRTRTI